MWVTRRLRQRYIRTALTICDCVTRGQCPISGSHRGLALEPRLWVRQGIYGYRDQVSEQPVWAHHRWWAGGGNSSVADLVRIAAALHIAGILSPQPPSCCLHRSRNCNHQPMDMALVLTQHATPLGTLVDSQASGAIPTSFRDSGYGVVVLSNCGGASEPVVAKLLELILTDPQPSTDV